MKAVKPTVFDKTWAGPSRKHLSTAKIELAISISEVKDRKMSCPGLLPKQDVKDIG
jgi:hypothetical protein